MKTIILIIGIFVLSLNQLWSQSARNSQIPLIGSEAPAFKAQSTNGDINFPKDFGKSWKILFAHPKDFTPVCSSEILELAHQQEDYKALNTKVVVVSTDVIDSHNSWKAALEEVEFKGKKPVKIHFPLVEDHTYSIARSYGMIDTQANAGQSVRGVFFIDPENKVRAFSFYPNEVGRSSEEIKRTLIALQTNYSNPKVVLPSNWQPGEDVMLPHMDVYDQTEMKKSNSKIYQKAWFMTYMKTGR
jgi:peroxiredoxin 2/4